AYVSSLSYLCAGVDKLREDAGQVGRRQGALKFRGSIDVEVNRAGEALRWLYLLFGMSTLDDSQDHSKSRHSPSGETVEHQSFDSCPRDSTAVDSIEKILRMRVDVHPAEIAVKQPITRFVIRNGLKQACSERQTKDRRTMGQPSFHQPAKPVLSLHE